jgi:hypothetical protein
VGSINGGLHASFDLVHHPLKNSQPSLPACLCFSQRIRFVVVVVVVASTSTMILVLAAVTEIQKLQRVGAQRTIEADMDYKDKLAQLKARVDDIDLQLAALLGQRREHSFAASNGDAKSVKAITDNDAESSALAKDRQTTLDAIEQCVLLVKKEDEALEQKLRQQRENDNRRHCETYLQIAAELDKNYKDAESLHIKLRATGSAIGACGIVPHNVVSRLLSKLGPSCSARFFGLHNYIDIAHQPPHMIMSLFEASSVLKSFIKKPVERYKTQEQEQEERATP